MYKTLLVDDEVAILRNMQTLVDWGKWEFEVAGTASNAIQALERMERETIHLVITDIRMPGMDGIELAREIRKKYPDTEVIILSGYDEFDYAKSALRAGVAEYLTKPTDLQELYAALERIKHRICAKQRAHENLEQLEEEVKKHIPVLKNQYFCELLSGYIDEETAVLKKLQYYESPLTGKPFYLCAFGLDNGNGKADNLHWKEIACLYLKHITEQALWKKYGYDFFEQGENWYCIIEKENTDLTINVLETLLTDIIQEFCNLTDFSISVGVSGLHHTYVSLFKAGRECMLALGERFHLGENSCIFYEEICITQDEFVSVNYQQINLLVLKLHTLNLDEAVQAIIENYARLKKEKAMDQLVYSQTVLLLVELGNLVSPNNEKLQKKIRTSIADLKEYQTVDALQQLVVSLAEVVLPEAYLEKNDCNKALVKSIEDYVKEHLDQEITLQDTADAVHISKSYLCSVFKKQKGETFFDYLTGQRIQRAKKYLRETDYKVYVIAEKVGYRDYAYFAQVFKKVVGVTAKEYREFYS